jgi:hypothetical protein
MKRRNFLLKSAEFLGLGALVASGVIKAEEERIDTAPLDYEWEQTGSYDWWRNEGKAVDLTDAEMKFKMSEEYRRWEDVPLKAKEYAYESIKAHNALLK